MFIGMTLSRPALTGTEADEPLELVIDVDAAADER